MTIDELIRLRPWPPSGPPSNRDLPQTLRLAKIYLTSQTLASQMLVFHLLNSSPAYLWDVLNLLETSLNLPRPISPLHLLPHKEIPMTLCP